MLKVYDLASFDARPAKQQDLDDLQANVQKLGRLRVDLLKMVSSYFPTIAEDIEFGSAIRGRLNREFYRANGRHPDKHELRSLFEAYQTDKRV